MSDFPTAILFSAPAREGDPLEFLDDNLPTQKLEEWGYRMVKISWFYLQPFLYESPMWQTDRRTNGRWHIARKAYAILCCGALKTRFLRNAQTFLSQILLSCSSGYCTPIRWFRLYLF